MRKAESNLHEIKQAWFNEIMKRWESEIVIEWFSGVELNEHGWIKFWKELWTFVR